MISLRLILLVLVTLGCRELVEGNAETAPLLASLAAMGVSLGFGLLFKASALHVLAGSPQPLSPACWQRCAQARTNVERAWIVALPLALLATGWGAALNGLQEQGLPQAVSLLGWFLPSLFLIVLLELTAAQFDELYHQPPTPCDTVPYDIALHDIQDQLNDSPATTVSWQREWLLRLRLGDMASLVTCLTPVLAIAALTDAASYFANDVWMTRMIFTATILALLVVVLFLPVWLGRWMGVVNLPDGELSQRVATQMQALNIRGVRPKLVLSRGRWPGAAVVGWFPRFRQLWLGDALIERLSSRQFDMVVMHELAHIKRRHFLWRIFPVVWAASVVGLFGVFWPSDPAWELSGSIISSIAASVVMLAGVGVMAHACELDADVSACALAHQACPWAVDDSAAAARELGDALSELMPASSSATEATWLHPTLGQRLRNLACSPS
ncbi:MAG: M48 family metalloprotease [Planctomycetales bacterium]|nr:M48 family metalloprotease [Planctomycetales bacterium]